METTQDKSMILEKYEIYKTWVNTNYLPDPALEDAYRQSPGLDRHFAAYVSLHPRPLEQNEIEGANALMSNFVSDRLDLQYRDYIHRVLTAQFDNLPNEKLQTINLISVGSDCMPRTLFTKWGLRRSRKFGERTLPFDLAYAGSLGTLRLLIDDFRGMLDPEKLTIADWVDAPINVDYPIIFNHESGPLWRANGHEKLIERYIIRIQRFRSILSNGKTTIVVMNFVDPFSARAQDDLILAIKSLDMRTKGRIRFICVITGISAPEWQEKYEENITNKAILTRVYNEKPRLQYEFYQPECYTSLEGVKYERGFLEAIRSVVDIETRIKISLGDPAPPIKCCY